MGWFDASEAKVQSLKLDRQTFVIETHLFQNGGIDVANVDGILKNVVAKVVGDTVGDAALHAAASHPHGEALGMVIASVVCAGEFALAVDRATKFSAPDHKRVVQQASLLEILKERPRWLIDVAALVG